MIRILMGDTTLSNEEAGKWMADIMAKYQNINIQFNARTLQFEELKTILNERAIISKAIDELVENIELLKDKIGNASDYQLEKLEEVEKSIKELYAGIQIIKFNNSIKK